MKIKNSLIINTIKAINSIENLRGSPKSVFALSKNLNKLKKLNDDIESARKDIWKDNFGDTQEVEKNHANFAKFEKEFGDVLNIEVEYTPHQFLIADLDLNLNAISPYVLESISWLIKDFDDDATKTPVGSQSLK